MTDRKWTSLDIALLETMVKQGKSSKEIANAIGKPKAVRAVAGACASNHVALIIPCHRVIREDKSLGGYRWGLERKRKLLESEQHRKSAAAVNSV